MAVEAKIELLPHQYEFLTAQEKYVHFNGGIGTGKTHVASAFVVNQVVTEPRECVGFIGAQSHRQLHNAVFPHLKKAFTNSGIKYEFNEGKNFLTANSRKIIFNTMDKDSIETIMGSEIGWFWIDEAPYCPEYSMKMVKSRLRCPLASALKGRTTGSPNGFNWVYDWFVAHPDEFHRMITATTYDNPFLPDSYIADLKKQYTPLEFRQQCMAEFVNLAGGQVYDCYNDTKHAVKFDHKNLTGKIYIGMDFNVAQMCAVCVKFENGRFYVFDEIYLKDSNTIGMVKEIQKRFPNYRSDVVIVPDSTFSNRSTASDKTSKEILRRAKFKILPTRNPYIGERQQALNNAFWNAGIENDLKILVHPRCGHLRKELNTLTHDDKEGEVSHLAVALGYVLWKLDPLKRKRRRSKVIK